MIIKIHFHSGHHIISRLKRNYFIYFFLLIIFPYSVINAEVRLPSIIGDHMVLQQNETIKLWGWSDAGEGISVKAGWDTTTYFTKGDAHAKWLLEIKTPSSGGPYSITIKGYNSITIKDVVIGEVWLCSGQSNMEWSVNWGLKNYEEEAQKAFHNEIRFFHIPRTAAYHPQEDVKARWVVCTPEEMRKFSAVGYFFGKKINEQLQVPVGLINSSWGGTPAETWTPADLIHSDPVLSSATKQLNVSEHWPITPGLTYNAMLYPLKNFIIKGVIWYQGEGNVGQTSYKHLFSTMIKSWRKLWGKDFFFYFVQIAPYARYGNNNISSPLIREAQTQTLSLPKTGMVVTSDLVDDINDIHPKLKKEVGHRLANYALADAYKIQGIAYKTPIYKSMKVEKNKIRLYFENAPNGFVTKGGKPTEFFIAGEDKKFVPANASIEGTTIVVWHNKIKDPVVVRFGFTNAAIPNIYSEEGLPVNLFRTDN